MDRRLLGAFGESLAARYYRENGYRILETNYRTRLGEIDLIVSRADVLVFAEVKTRSANAIAAPCEFVTPAKQRRIILAAQSYLSGICASDPIVRFDVVEVQMDVQNVPSVRCIENAFSLD